MKKRYSKHELKKKQKKYVEAHKTGSSLWDWALAWEFAINNVRRAFNHAFGVDGISKALSKRHGPIWGFKFEEYKGSNRYLLKRHLKKH